MFCNGPSTVGFLHVDVHVPPGLPEWFGGGGVTMQLTSLLLRDDPSISGASKPTEICFK